MTTRQTLQHKIDESSKISEHLMTLRQNFALSNREIASRLGVSEAFVSRALHGKTTSGRQFLAGLELLLELTILKRTGVNQVLALELKSMKDRIEELQTQIIPRYPEHRPQNLAVNDDDVSSNSPGAGPEMVDLAAKLMGKKKTDPPAK